MNKNGFTTTLLHADRRRKPEHGATHQPVHPSVAYGYEDARELARVFQGQAPGYTYGRQNNPTVAALEDKITGMEGGVASALFATGMGAIAATLLALLRAGDHLVASRFLFGNTHSLLNTFAGHGIRVSLVDATRMENVAAALCPETRLVFVETIANPATQVADLARIGALCAERGLLYIVDNTMTSPYLFRPKDVQAGLIIHSLTKLIAGHGNVLGGSVTDTGLCDWTRFPNIDAHYKKFEPRLWGITQIKKKGLRDMGASLAPESAHHIAMGAETLALRVERACDNAQRLAAFFAEHPRIRRVHYPGLPDHPQHALAGTLFRRFGTLLSIDLDDALDCFTFINRLDVVIASSNLGDNRTLAIPVAHTIFHEMGPAQRAAQDISENMVRISVGIEDGEDLLADFAQALSPEAGLEPVSSMRL